MHMYIIYIYMSRHPFNGVESTGHQNLACRKDPSGRQGIADPNLWPLTSLKQGSILMQTLAAFQGSSLFLVCFLLLFAGGVLF